MTLTGLSNVCMYYSMGSVRVHTYGAALMTCGQIGGSAVCHKLEGCKAAEREQEKESDGRKIVYESWIGREVPRGNKAAEREQERERESDGRKIV